MKYYMACSSCREKVLVASMENGWTFYGSLPQCCIALGDWLRRQALTGCEPTLTDEAGGISEYREFVWSKS